VEFLETSIRLGLVVELEKVTVANVVEENSSSFNYSTRNKKPTSFHRNKTIYEA